MRKKSLTVLVASTLCCSILFSSCIGSFSLTNKLLSWNNRIDSKFINELVFIAFWIVPVYEVSAIADLLVINTIEFWSGDNPVADAGKVEKVSTKNGEFLVETKENGYHIQKEGEESGIDLVFNQDDKTWNIETEEATTKLMSFTENNEVIMYLPDGDEMKVELNAAGVMAFKQAATNYSFFAAK